MRRLQIMIEPELDDWLEREAALRGMSKGAIVRECVREGAEEKPFDNGLWKLAGIAGDAEPVDDIDKYLYGPGGVHA